MTKIWISPRVWDIGELVDDLKMQEVSNALEWLKDRPFDQKLLINTGANTVQAVTGVGNWFAIDDANLTLNISTVSANERVKVTFDLIFSTSGAASSGIWWDVLVDDTYYLSSGTATSSTIGLGIYFSTMAAAGVQRIFFEAYGNILAAGAHTLKVRFGGTNATTITIYRTNTNNPIRFTALDI